MRYSLNWLGEMISLEGLDFDALVRDLAEIGLLCEGSRAAGDDIIFDLELPANRGDLMSIIGLADEIATIRPGLEVRRRLDPDAPVPRADGGGDFSVSIEDPLDCPFYAGTLLEAAGSNPAPAGLAARIEAVGLRALGSPAVDITNYLLVETGQPMHAFDADRIEGGITVRRAREGESLTTIDGRARQLGPGVLVIADRVKVLAVAGVMGGRESEVTGATRRVFLESAYFSPRVVREGRQFLGMDTDSSARFERGVNPSLVVPAMDRAVEMLLDACSGRLLFRLAAGELPGAPGPIDFRPARCEAVLGSAIGEDGLARILQQAGFRVTRAASPAPWKVLPPPRRRDISLEIDLVEEVGRLHGYGRLPSRLPRVQVRPVHPDQAEADRFEALRDFLVRAGFDEVVTSSFEAGGDAAAARGALACVVNPLSEDQEVMRSSLLPGLASIISGSPAREPATGDIFESGTVFTRGEDGFREEKRFGLAVPGSGLDGLLRLKAVLAGMVRMAGGEIGPVEPFAHESLAESACLAREAGTPLAIFGKGVSGRFPFWGGEFLPGRKLAGKPPAAAFEPWSRFPGITRDYSFTVSRDIPWAFVESSVRAISPLVSAVEFRDLYRGPEMPDGCCGLTLSVIFQDPGRTLAGPDADAVEKEIIATLAAAGLALREGAGKR